MALEQANIKECLARLKFNLREKSSPFFTDEELLYFLGENDFNIPNTSYKLLIMKAEDDSITLPSGLTVPNNRTYWLSLAKQYRQNNGRCMKRADEN